jgi:hypothetical protein
LPSPDRSAKECWVQACPKTRRKTQGRAKVADGPPSERKDFQLHESKAKENQMISTKENTTKDAQASTPDSAEPDTSATQQPTAEQRPQVQVDDTKAVTSYANFCRVTGTPEELIVDFGLNSQPVGVPSVPLVITQRIIVNYYTAKRLLAALQMSLQRHEGAFGVLETDVQKRVQPSALRQPASAAN